AAGAVSVFVIMMSDIPSSPAGPSTSSDTLKSDFIEVSNYEVFLLALCTKTSNSLVHNKELYQYSGMFHDCLYTTNG
ncbi:hypothetical protein, partial [Vibrio metoecus]|uniref:hypothetical protein n=1 Tax=Vibrio metoecus TaxID=1481663 RepID=UPI00051103EE